ncbi:response regulator [Siphonobacter sp. SORGH_AS_0500]|uniref:response regulator n=1 Tax=Siphonobacter sp. SORGH_AS_0500 TaxID=1864824 RepID=UPI00285E3F32|nr:response regulator [Siphonobacter sp. SORGH_AS_0500]MDR6193331.1 CheY-like chemotaxis protein [Siphonobacter sp. SORGH_AS_0500]
MSHQGPILLIDDDADDHFIFESILEELGVSNKILSFYDGKQALDYLLTTTEQPFVILCDINMPVMNGVELHQAIIESEFLRKKAIPFVFLTTAANSKVVNLAYEQSVQGFFQKSTSMDSYEEQLRSIINYWRNCLHPNVFPL